MFQGWRDVEQEQVLHVLKKLKELFADKDKWIDWPLAEDETGLEVKPDNPKAVKFCLMGASELFTKQQYEKPLCDYIECAVRDYLNELTNNDLILGKLDYDGEMLALNMGIEELDDKIPNDKDEIPNDKDN